jgi:hypothetical protein
MILGFNKIISFFIHGVFLNLKFDPEYLSLVFLFYILQITKKNKNRLLFKQDNLIV